MKHFQKESRVLMRQQGTGKKAKKKIITGGKILKMGEDSGDQRDAQREMALEVQGLWMDERLVSMSSSTAGTDRTFS